MTEPHMYFNVLVNGFMHKLISLFVKVSVALGTFVIVSIVVFLLLRLTPGGPLAEAERISNMSAEQFANLRELYGLDQSMPEQYWRYLSSFITGNWGDSIRNHRPSIDIIFERIPWTILLVGTALLIVVPLSLAIGINSAEKFQTKTDFFSTFLLSIGQSIPAFWLGTVLILIFYVWIKNPITGGALFPSSGVYTLGREEDILNYIWHLVLPVVTLTIGWLPWYARYVRTGMIEIMREDYIRTARAKGVSEKGVIYKHALANLLPQLSTIIALDVPALFSGALLIEVVFAWPGMGRLFWDAIRSRDYPILFPIIMLNIGLIVFFNLLADIFSKRFEH